MVTSKSDSFMTLRMQGSLKLMERKEEVMVYGFDGLKIEVRELLQNTKKYFAK
jgi:hypothetical protein